MSPPQGSGTEGEERSQERGPGAGEVGAGGGASGDLLLVRGWPGYCPDREMRGRRGQES